jgi:hypothetical protein
MPDTPTVVVTTDPPLEHEPNEDVDNPREGVEAATIKILTGGVVISSPDPSIRTSQGYLYLTENP